MSAELRLLHTSDLHLGDAVHEGARWQGFRAVLVAARSADLLLIAGDLFDHARVDPDALEAVAEGLSALGVPSVVVPGNHDLAGPGSVLARLQRLITAEHVHFLLDPDGESVEVTGLDLVVWGRGMVEHSPDNRPLSAHRPPASGRWHVAGAHGHVQKVGTGPPGRSSPIRPDEIDALECDYLALGHWHRRRDVSTRRVRAGYCGAPVPESAPSSGTADLVRISPLGRVCVEPVALA